MFDFLTNSDASGCTFLSGQELGGFPLATASAFFLGGLHVLSLYFLHEAFAEVDIASQYMPSMPHTQELCHQHTLNTRRPAP